MATPEGRVKAKVKRRLKAEFGTECWPFMPVQMGYGVQALDFLLCIKGYFFAIETKAPGKKPTPLQDTTIATIREAGGLVFVVEGDETLDAAIACIKAKETRQ
jgi:hypothetical protein